MSKEFLVNSYSAQWQQNPDIARLKNGDFIVVWQSFLSETDPDIDLYYVGAQRFSGSGKRIGGEFIVDLDVVVDGGASTSPSVTALNDGGFAVGWENSKDGILGSTDVYARAFDANGKPRGDSVLAHTERGEDQKVPELSATKNGFFVSFTDYDGSKGLKFENVYLQRFDNDGDRVGGGARVNQVTDLDQQCTQSAELSNGDTIVIWDSEKTGPDTVKGRIFNSDGKVDTKEFLISDENGDVSSAISPDSSIDVAALSKGRFVATWYETKLNGGGDDTTFEIHGRIFDQNGRQAGGEFKVEATRAACRGIPRWSASRTAALWLPGTNLVSRSSSRSRSLACSTGRAIRSARNSSSIRNPDGRTRSSPSSRRSRTAAFSRSTSRNISTARTTRLEDACSISVRTQPMRRR